MVLTKLAARNVKRQIGNYLIYFITVSLTVALMYAFCNMLYNEEFQRYARVMVELRSSLRGILIFVSLFVAFILGYATSHMLKLRKREFGTYLTLGMTRKNILNVFILETVIMCAAALALGIIAGLFLYQGIMVMATHLMNIEFAFAAYSFQGLISTVVLVCGIFVLASVISAVYLKRVSIYDLIHGDKKVTKVVRFPVFWLFVTLICFCIILASGYRLYFELNRSIGNTNGVILIYLILALGIAVLLFHIGLARSVTNLMLKSKRLCAKGTNTFIFRQLSGKLGPNSIMAGILSFLIFFAIIGSNMSFWVKVSQMPAINQYYPFDISARLDKENGDPAIKIDDAKKVIRDFTDIEFSLPYNIYTTGKSDLYSMTDWSTYGYKEFKDSFVRESDYNKLLAVLGKKEVALNGGYRIVSNLPQVSRYDFSNADLKLGDRIYQFEGFSEEMPLTVDGYFFAVVPDQVAEGMSIQSECIAMNVVDNGFDVEELWSALSYDHVIKNGPHSYKDSDFNIREYIILKNKVDSAIFIISMLYISIVFVFMAMAILALKTLSELSDDRQRYSILYRLGTGYRELSKTLFRQIFSFFFLPFALPIILSIPITIGCAQLIKLSGYDEIVGLFYTSSIMLSLTLIAIYLLYFAATYLIASRNVLHEMS